MSKGIIVSNLFFCSHWDMILNQKIEGKKCFSAVQYKMMKCGLNLLSLNFKVIRVYLLIIVLSLLFHSCKTTNRVLESAIELGIASWYGPGFHHKKTLNTYKDLADAEALERIKKIDRGD